LVQHDCGNVVEQVQIIDSQYETPVAGGVGERVERKSDQPDFPLRRWGQQARERP
jgi:hypothetical protein